MSTIHPMTSAGEHPPGEFRFFLDLLAARPTLVQGVYYVLLGLWPWLNAESFLWATDQKADPWLVQTVGALLAVIGLTLGIAGARREESWAVCCLGLGSIAALAFCDIFFVSRGKVSSIHVVDAVLQGGLGALWFLHWQKPSGRFQADARA